MQSLTSVNVSGSLMLATQAAESTNRCKNIKHISWCNVSQPSSRLAHRRLVVAKALGKATTEGSDAASTVGYDSKRSVFPAESVEEVGRNESNANAGPEVKLPPREDSKEKQPEGEDRETVSYDSSKTVFPGEACDDLGGEFCDEEYQKGVGKDK